MAPSSPPPSPSPIDLNHLVRHGLTAARARRYQEANRLLLAALARGAFVAIPESRAPLLRLYSRALFSPAAMAGMLGRASIPSGFLEPPLVAAIQDAVVMAVAYRQIQTDDSLDAHQRERLLAMCAWEAGDPVVAYAHSDEAEVHKEGDLLTSYLLVASAIAVGSPELKSILAFAIRDALAVVARCEKEEAVPEDERLAAALIMARAKDQGAVLNRLAEGAEDPLLLGIAKRGPLAPVAEEAAADTPEPPAPDSTTPLAAQLERLVRWRATLRTMGHPRATLALRAAEAHRDLPLNPENATNLLAPAPEELLQRLEKQLGCPVRRPERPIATTAAMKTEDGDETTAASATATAPASPATAQATPQDDTPAPDEAEASSELQASTPQDEQTPGNESLQRVPRWVVFAPIAALHVLEAADDDSTLATSLRSTLVQLFGERTTST